MDFSVGGLLSGGKQLFDSAGGVDGIKTGFNEVSDSDAVQNVKASWNLGSKLDDVEDTLEEHVTADNVNISADQKSQMGEFVQKALVALGQDKTPATGMLDKETMAELNGFFKAKVASESDNVSIMGVGADKFENLTTITDPSQLTGRHIQSLVNELREQDAFEDNPDLVGELGQALRDVNNISLQSIADDFDPAEVPKVDAAVEGQSAEVNATADSNSSVDNNNSVDDNSSTMEKIGEGAGDFMRGIGFKF